MCWAIILLSFFSTQQPDEMGYLLKNIPDVPVRTAESSLQPLSSWYSQKPMILTLAYSRCPGVCSPYVLQIRDQLAMQSIAEDKFQMVVLSFDSTDNAQTLSKLAGYSKVNPPPSNWTFAVLSTESREELAASLGLKWEKLGELYDHNSLLLLVSTEGKILQRVEGLPSNDQWNRLFREITHEFVPVYSTLGENIWTSCFRYDPASGTWRMNWGLLLILIPSVATVCILLILQTIIRVGATKKIANTKPIISHDPV